MQSGTTRIISFLIITAYLYLSVFSLFMILGHEHAGMLDCPYTIGHSLCAMSTFEHLSAWKSISLTIPSSLYIFSIFLIVTFATILPTSSSPPMIRGLMYYKSFKFKPITVDIEKQLSDGILNPKPY